MKKAIVLLLIFLPASAFCQHYGEALTMNQPLSLQQAIAQIDSADAGSTLLVEARVGSVCQEKGCWLSLEDETGEMRVTFKDYGFFVPFAIKGKTVWVQGTMERIEMSLEETRHYVADAGGDPDQVTEPQKEYRMVASGVEIRG